MAFGEVLIERRLAAGLSQEALAERSTVSVRTISDLERGVTQRPRGDTVRALSDGLALDPTERADFERAARRAPPASRRGRPASRVSLPAPVSSIVGRDHDVTAVARLVRGLTARLVTVTGAGGVGKSRFALEVAWRVRNGFDRVDAADLSPLQSAHDVPAALATALGIGPSAARSGHVAALAARIENVPWLLLVDNFEHVLDAAETMAGLLARCPRLHLLVTSRAPLRLRGEHVWPLPPLPVPAGEAEEVSALADNPAVTLLAERARAVRPGFALSAGNAVPVATLCRLVEGLPLAIELAAAQLRVLEPAELVAQLGANLTRLSIDVVDLADRHRSLRATVEWSTNRLSPSDRLLLGVLSAFPAGAVPSAVRAVFAGAGLDGTAFDAGAASLAGASLLTAYHRRGRARVTMLATIREIAAESLRASGLEVAVRRAHARYFLDMVTRTRDLPDGFDDADAELDNVRAALSWAIEHDHGNLDMAVVRALTDYFTSRGLFREARRTLLAIAEVAGDDGTRAYALHGAGIAANEVGDTAYAIELSDRSAALFDKAGDRTGHCAALTLLGNAHKARDEYDAARRAHAACLTLAHSIGDLRRVTITHNNLGTLAHECGDHETARYHHTHSLLTKRQLGEQRGVGVSLANLGALDNDLGRYDEASRCLREAVEIFSQLGEQHVLGFALAMLAEAQLGLGGYAAAVASAKQALVLGRRIHHDPTIGLALGRLGDVAAARGEDEAAQHHYIDALQYAREAPEIARILEHLAAVRVHTAADDARHLLHDADQTRHDHRVPIPPAQRRVVQQLRAVLAAQA